MASDDTTTIHSSVQDEDFDYDIEDGYDLYRHPHPHNMSRLSVCTSSTTCGFEDNDDVGDVNDDMAMHVSRLSIESFEAGDGDDADGELSDVGKHPHTADVSSNSDNESNGCYSLPATGAVEKSQVAAKEYASENEAQKKKKKRKNRNRSRRRNMNMNMNMWMLMERGEQFSHGESDGVKVITRPKGGRRSLCMDLEEIKACRDLGFELEHERMLEIPSHLSMSNSTLDMYTTSSGSNSPIANWRISTPGDDPRDVKARLKVWAQAVAVASTSKYMT